MDIGLREWLIVGAIIVIVLIVVDGWRRMRAQSNSLKIDIDEKLSDLGDDCYNPELPIGTARVFVPKDNKKNSANSAQASNKQHTTAPLKSQKTTTQVQSKVAGDSYQSRNSAVEKSAELTASQVLDSTSQTPAVASGASASLAFPASEDRASTEVNDLSIDNTALDSNEHQLGYNTSVNEPSNTSTATSDQTLVLDDCIAIKKDSALQAPELTEYTVQKPTALATPKHQIDVKERYSEADKLSSYDLPHTVSGKQISATEMLEVATQLDSNLTAPLRQVDDSNLDDDSLIVPAILKSNHFKKQPATSDSVVQNQTVAEADFDEMLSSTIDNLHKSGREMELDKFEQLLAERESDHSHIETNDDGAEKNELAVNIANLSGGENSLNITTDLEPPGATELTDELSAKQHEIDQLKAKLLELSEEQSGINSEQPANFITTVDQPSKSENIELTRVIDDEVNLEDIALEELGLEGLKIADLKIEDLLLEPSVQEQSAMHQQYTSSTTAPSQEQNDLSIEGPAKKDSFEIDADPLMDSFVDAKASEELVDQFEQDLAEDSQSVAHELDMPITEILKMNRQMDASQASSKAEKTAEDADLAVDPLLADRAVQDDLLSIDSFTEQVKQQQDSQSRAEVARQVDGDDGIDHANDLGFTALEQDYELNDKGSSRSDFDPLMDGFKDIDDAHPIEGLNGVDEERLSVNAVELSHESQKSLFQELATTEVKPEANTAVNDSVKKVTSKSRKSIANVDDPNVVLIVTVVAKNQYLNGAALKKVVQACGMEFGDMEVFHRFEDGKAEGAIQFSMANAIKPGTFDIETMDETSTPGVSFFMSMDEPLDPKNALECMMATAETVATHLNGDLLDDDRSVIRPQTKEHYRERVRMHEMHKLRRRAQ
ncbi:MAG: hypothetical protein OFPII_17660 [Osedax symbiont Rs1]|nr:MAG: hypothetical protein OFPII_17660 [Osedax symbiont Rs1]